jgi:hypothetical protein
MTRDEFAAKVIGDLADAILALINSKPSSPTRDELIKVISQHEVPDREIRSITIGIATALRDLIDAASVEDVDNLRR